MSGDGDSSDALTGAPVDFDRLATIRDRLSADSRFTQIDESPALAPDRLVCVYNPRFYPERVQTARLEIVWFENENFSLHYHETHESSDFDHRWDRHPSSHNTRDHVHPGPDAPTPGTDTSHPVDWRDVLSMALAEIDDRQRAFWDQ